MKKKKSKKYEPMKMNRALFALENWYRGKDKKGFLLEMEANKLLAKRK